MRGGQYWSEEEYQELIKLYLEDAPMPMMVKRIGRNEISIRSAAYRLRKRGVLLPKRNPGLMPNYEKLKAFAKKLQEERR